jgi:hypothetical protein
MTKNIFISRYIVYHMQKARKPTTYSDRYQHRSNTCCAESAGYSKEEAERKDNV